MCPFRPAERDAALVLERGEEFESAVAEPPSDGSSGICTFSTGRLPPPPSCAEFVREGGVNPSGMDDMEMLRFLLWVWARVGGGEGLVGFAARETDPTSTEWLRLLEVAVSEREVSALEVLDAQCWERIERDSSIGVKMLRDLTDIRFTGSSSCWGACCCCSCSC